MTQKSKIIDLMAKPLIPPWKTAKLIPSTARWQFDFTLASSDFLLKWPPTETGGPFKLQLLKADLLVTRVEIAARASASAQSVLQRDGRLIYPYIEYSLHNFSLPNGQKEFRIQNMMLPAYLHCMFVFMIKEAALIGNPQECPFW